MHNDSIYDTTHPTSLKAFAPFLESLDARAVALKCLVRRATLAQCAAHDCRSRISASALSSGALINGSPSARDKAKSQDVEAVLRISPAWDFELRSQDSPRPLNNTDRKL